MRTARLGKHVEILSGFAFKSGQFNLDGRGLPLVRIRDVKPARSDTYYEGEYDERFVLSDGDLLVGMDGEFNSARWKGGRALLNQRVCRIRSASASLDEQYLFWFLPKALKDIEDKSNFVTVKHLSSKQINDIQIPLPPLDEQKRIAAILDQADELRCKRQRTIDRLNELGQAIFHEMFGDPKSNPRDLPWVSLGEIADFYSGNSLPEGEVFTGQLDGHLLLKVSDLNHELNQQNIVCAATWSPSPGSRAGTCPRNALVFPKRGGAIGTNKKRWLKRSAILDPNLMGVYPNEDRLTMSFLNGWFQTFNLSDIASGSSVPQLNKQDLAPLRIALPPIAEQLEYGRRMEALADTRQGYGRAMDCLSRLFSSLQHRAFQGGL
ncbi:MAG: restriction endonuclease subunit S [Brevundimonas sp.]|jgi:type I restriction enzyme S subunit|uniref:restriction endonuclease subunit S n=1 Tax=Brevundimonas sp. TaxID=1871086 RepID=UPI00391F272E